MNNPNARGLSLVSNWMDHMKERDQSKHTIDIYSRGLARFNAWLVNNTKHDITDADPSHLKEFRKSMINVRNYDARSINVWMSGIKNFYRWWIRKDEEFAGNLSGEVVHLPNPWDKVKSIKISRDNHNIHKRHVLSDEEVRALFKTCSGDKPKQLRDRAILGMCVFGALRVGEIWRINCGDVCTKEDGRGIIEIQSKGSKSKSDSIVLSKPLEEMIKEWRAVRDKTHEPALFICLDRVYRGDRISTRSIRQAIKDRFQQAGISGSPHNLRHTAITNAFRQGGSIYQIKIFARVSSYEDLLMYYHESSNAEKPIEYSIKYGLPEEGISRLGNSPATEN